MKYASRHGELLLSRFRGGIVVTAETGRVLLLIAGRRAAFWLGLRHGRSGVWVTCAALSAVLRRRNNGGVLSWGFRRAKRRLKNGGGILYAAVCRLSKRVDSSRILNCDTYLCLLCTLADWPLAGNFLP